MRFYITKNNSKQNIPRLAIYLWSYKTIPAGPCLNKSGHESDHENKSGHWFLLTHCWGYEYEYQHCDCDGILLYIDL